MKFSNKEINASSMADIAFLLLIFFLVTTTIDQDKGILSKLPPDETTEQAPVHSNNVLEININARNEIYLEKQVVDISEVKNLALKHLRNNGVNPNLADNAQKAIVSLQNDRATSYNMYIMIQNELKAAYTVVRDEATQKLTNGKYSYQQIKTCADESSKKSIYCKKIKDQVKALYPMKITEKDPVDLKIGKNSLNQKKVK